MFIPEDFKIRMQTMLGAEYEEFIHAFSEGAQHTGLRIARPAARALIIKTLTDAEPVLWCPDGFYTDKSKISGTHPYHLAGLVYFQEPSAMSAVEALDIRPGDRVLDLCAAPGGKATQAGAKLGGTGLLVANEIIPKRAQILAENMERCGISNNSVVTNENPQRLSVVFPGFFNKIIVDAPCSGEGMFRKEPRAIEEWSVAHTESCALRQRHILDCAVQMLAPGGSLVYSTCTFAPCENEGVVDDLLACYPELRLAEITLPGLDNGNGDWVKTTRDLSRTKRIFPHHQKGEGHFVALLYKNGQDEAAPLQIKTNEPPADYRKFEEQFLNIHLTGHFQLFGEHLYRLVVDVQNLKVVRAGQYLGVCKKGRFEPAHALALACKKEDIKNTLDFSADDPQLLAFLHGETLPCDHNGWTTVCVDGFPTGWGKASGGVLKNHVPKMLRI